METGTKAALGRRRVAARPDAEQEKRIKQQERLLNCAVLEALPFGSRGMSLTLTTDNGTQFTSGRNVETLNQLGSAHRHTLTTIPRQELHRAVPLQLERRGGVAQRIPEL
jgi:hypothetical protein